MIVLDLSLFLSLSVGLLSLISIFSASFPLLLSPPRLGAYCSFLAKLLMVASTPIKSFLRTAG